MSGAQPSDRRVVSRKAIHRCAKWSLECITFENPSGEHVVREVVRHPGSTVILPILDDGRIVLIRNLRLSIERELWELPAGTMEVGEQPEACARRELQEEAGYAAATWTPLTRFYTSPGLTDEVMWAYAASGLKHVGQDLEADEIMTVHPLPIAMVIEMIERGEIADAKSMLTILLARKRGLV